MEKLAATVGNAIAAQRRKAAISQEQLAERAGIHRTYVSQLERGLKVPTLEVFFAICMALDVKPQLLVGQIDKILHGVPNERKDQV